MNTSLARVGLLSGGFPKQTQIHAQRSNYVIGLLARFSQSLFTSATTEEKV